MGSNGKPKATVYRVAGLNLWAEQFPVLIERVDTGKTYKRTAHEVKLALQNGAIKMTPGQGCS
jgi:PII-like signaling protein